jgi:hypothetical protein
MIRPCRASSSGVTLWAIIRKPTVSSPSSRASPKCCWETSASVQWVAIRQMRRAVVGGLADVVLQAHAGQHQERDLGPRGGLDGDLDQIVVGRVAEAVVERGAAQAVAVGHLDDRDARVVERGDDRGHVLAGELVLLRVRSVTQRRIGDPDVVELAHVDASALGRCTSRLSISAPRWPRAARRPGSRLRS